MQSIHTCRGDHHEEEIKNNKVVARSQEEEEEEEEEEEIFQKKKKEENMVERMNFSSSPPPNQPATTEENHRAISVGSPDLLLENNAPPTKIGGGWKTMPYIIGNETFEKLASMSLVANLTVYLRSQYNMDGLLSVSVMNIWGGTSNFAPLFGAFLSDSYFGRYWTLLGASFCSFLGMGIMTLTAAINTLRPPNCETEGILCEPPEKWQLAVLFTGLGFLAIGAGGIRPCNIAFGVDQFDSTTEKGRNQIETFYNWYYWSFTLALLVALTVVVYIQNNISWAIGLAIPTIFLALSIFVFLLGSRVYIYMKPRGSVYVDLAKITAAAFHKRKVKIEPVCEYTLYDPPINEPDPSVSKLRITKRFSCLNKAAVITEHDSFDDQGLPRDGWRLCSVQQVEQFKSIISVFPVWASGICCFIAMDQQNTQGILQAIQTDTRLVNEFRVPPGSLGIISMLALSIWIPIFEHLFLPLSRSICKDSVGITLKHRLGAGIVMSFFCMLIAGIVEGKRRDLALSNHSFEAPMTFAWLLPQFVLSGMTEAFSGIGMMEFLGRKFPSTMRTLAASTFFLSLAIASYLSSFLINLVHNATKTDISPGWLGGRDLNINRLDYYYYFVAGLCVLNLIYYTTYASWYVDSDNVEGQNSNESELNQISD